MDPLFLSALNAIPEECWTCKKEECDRANCIPFRNALKKFTDEFHKE